MIALRWVSLPLHFAIAPTLVSVEQRHVKTPEMLDKAVDMLHSFRNYIHYHIKCCKGYMHTRMRTRYVDLLKVLNQADPTKGF